MKEYIGKEVRVLWNDTETHGGWHEDKEIGKLSTAEVYTWGKMLAVDRAVIKVAGSCNMDPEADKEVGDVSVIPRSLIQEIVEIAPVEKKRKKQKR